MEEWSERDQFRTQYAVLGKHILCRRSELKLYQIQRSMHYSKEGFGLAKKGASYFKKTKTGKQLILNAKTKILATQAVKKAIDIGKYIKGAVGVAALVGTGLVIGIAIAAALTIYEWNNEKKKPTLEASLQKVIVKEEFDKIEAYLEAYLKCYENKDNFVNYFQKMFQKGTGSIQQTEKLMSKKNYIMKKIMESNFQQYQMDTQVSVLELYYQLSKSLIEIVSIGWKKDVKCCIQSLEGEHKAVKKRMIKIIRKNILKDGSCITIKGKTEASFYDISNICNEDLFAQSIFDQIFKCPVTEYQIDYLYDVSFWTEPGDEKTTINPDLPTEDQVYKYIGFPQKEYSSTGKHQGHRIRKMTTDGTKWGFYYEDTSTKAGFHDERWNNPPMFLEIDHIIALYVSPKGLISLNKDYESKLQVPQNYQLGKNNMNYCIEFPKDKFLQEVRYNKKMEMCFVMKDYSEKEAVKKKCNETFQGYIAFKNGQQRVGYGCKNKYKFIFTKGYNFHGKDSEDNSQKLIFQAVTALGFFDDSPEANIFTCRITNKDDRKMYMVRDNRDQQMSDFGNNSEGGELIRIQLNKKLSFKNEYVGTMFVAGCQAYISASNNLKWTSGKVPPGRKTEFYFYLDQI